MSARFDKQLLVNILSQLDISGVKFEMEIGGPKIEISPFTLYKAYPLIIQRIICAAYFYKMKGSRLTNEEMIEARGAFEAAQASWIDWLNSNGNESYKKLELIWDQEEFEGLISLDKSDFWRHGKLFAYNSNGHPEVFEILGYIPDDNFVVKTKNKEIENSNKHIRLGVEVKAKENSTTYIFVQADIKN